MKPARVVTARCTIVTRTTVTVKAATVTHAAPPADGRLKGS